MSDPLSLTSSVFALTTFTIQASKLLYGVVSSYQKRTKNLRELNAELEALDAVLKTLKDTSKDGTIDFSALKLPLYQCGQTCKDFAEYIKKYTARSKGDNTSIRDWLSLTYRGKDISDFKNILAAYKSTITIALADANIRYVQITKTLLEQYKATIEDTKSDLQELLFYMDSSRQNSLAPRRSQTLSDMSDLDETALEEERASIEQCLQVCLKVSKHIDQVAQEIVASSPVRNASEETIVVSALPTQARDITTARLTNVRTGIEITKSELQSLLQDNNRRFARYSSTSNRQRTPSEQRDADEELESIRRCYSICEAASSEARGERVNIFENIEGGDDSRQIIVSTIGDLISGKNIKSGARSALMFGQVSEDNVLQFTQSYAAFNPSVRNVNTSTTPGGSSQGDRNHDPKGKQKQTGDAEDNGRASFQGSGRTLR